MSSKQLKRFFEPAFHNTKRFFLFSLIFLIRRIYDFVNVLAFANIISAIEELNYIQFVNIIVYFIIFILGYQILNYVYAKCFSFYEWEIRRYLYETYLPRMIDIDNNYIESLGTGKVMTIFSKWIEYRSQFTEKVVWKSISMISMMIFTIIMVAHVSRVYFCILLWVGIVFDLIAIKLKDFWHSYRLKKYDLIAESNRLITKFIMSKHEVMQNNKWIYEANHIGDVINQANLEGQKQWPYEHRWYNSVELWLVLTKLIILYGIGSMVLVGKATISELVGIIAIIWYLTSASQDFVIMIKEHIKNGANLTKFWEFLDTAPRIENLHVWNNFNYFEGNINIHTISYAYDTYKVFEEFSLDIMWWKKTAFVGESWWWKSTLIKLLAWYISPQVWHIAIDGQILSDIKLTDYYKHIWYLTQDPSVFDGTIYENLLYALNYEPEEDRIKEVISQAQCDFIREFKTWLQTEIGEKGVRLSWGQKQRLAIAKIMLKNPDIILLDEPTSALDSFNEEKISIALANLFRNKTVIIVAHRLQTVKNADRILFFEHGKVIEDGTHDELIAYGWRYKKMLDLQSGF